jgi:hypothetical protein
MIAFIEGVLTARAFLWLNMKGRQASDGTMTPPEQKKRDAALTKRPKSPPTER